MSSPQAHDATASPTQQPPAFLSSDPFPTQQAQPRRLKTRASSASLAASFKSTLSRKSTKSVLERSSKGAKAAGTRVRNGARNVRKVLFGDDSVEVDDETLVVVQKCHRCRVILLIK